MQNDQKAKRMDDDDDKENDNTEQEQENHTIPLWLDCDTGTVNPVHVENVCTAQHSTAPGGGRSVYTSF